MTQEQLTQAIEDLMEKYCRANDLQGDILFEATTTAVKYRDGTLHVVTDVEFF